MEGNKFLWSRKWMAVPIAILLSLSGFYVFFMIDDEAEGATSLGTINVTSGTRTFNDVDYILDGNITVTGSGSNLIFTNCSLTISQDVGLDGVFGGTDDHLYFIKVENGGNLEFHNSYITTQTDQLHPYFMMDFEISGSGSRILFQDSIMEGPAEITADNGARIDSVGSIFKELDDKSDLSFDIDGDGSTDDDHDYNDDGPLFTFQDGARGLITDSQLRDTFSFSTSSRDGRIAGNITVDGSGTNVTFINSFLDIDFESNSSTGSHNMLKITGGAVAHIVGSSFNVSAADYNYPAVFVEDSGSKAVYYRWVVSRVLDGLGLPINGQTLDIYRVEGGVNRRLASGSITSDMISYTGRTSLTWSDTNSQGWAFVPVITDVIRSSTMPNSNSYPDFMVEVVQGTETISAHTSFMNYPKVPDQGEAVGIVSAILDGSADNTYGFSDLGGPFQFKQYVIDPSASGYFSDLDVDLTLNSAMSLKGSSAIVGGTFYPSYYAFDGHLIIRSGGKLTINDTKVSFLTDGSPAYILIEDGGILEMNNVTLGSTSEDDLYIYLTGSNSPHLYMDMGSIESGSIVGRDTAVVDVSCQKVNTSLNLFGSGVSVDVKAEEMNIEDLFARDCELALGNGEVKIGDLDWMGVDLISMNASFSSILDVDGTASLTNVSYTGQLPDGRSSWLMATGTGVIERSWWIDAKVEDSVGNPVEGASIDIKRISGPLNTDVASYATGIGGIITFSLLEEEIRSSGRTYLGNYKMNASFRGLQSDPLSAVISGSDVDAVVMLPGGPNIVPEMLWTEGTLIDGFPVNINGKISNIGEYDSDPFSASIMIDDEAIHTEMIPGLGSGNSYTLNTTWFTVEGDVSISLGVDVLGEVRETDEDDNDLIDINTIGIGPDYVVDMFVPPVVWSYNTTGSLEIFVTNDGEEDPEENSFYVNVSWVDSPESGVIESYIEFDYIPPGETVTRIVNWTPENVGTLSVVASVISKYDRSLINSVDIRTIEVLTLPDLDLVLNSFSVDVPAPVTINTTAGLSFIVINNGELPAGPFMVSVYDGEISDETKVDMDRSVPGLSPGDEIELTFTWFAGEPVGIHDLIIWIDSNNMISEQFEDNNERHFPVMVDTPPDLTFTTNLGVSPSVVTEGKNATFWATVRNNGNTMARNVVVQFSLDSDTNVIDSLSVDLAPGQEVNLSIGWIAARSGGQSGFRTMFIVADPLDSILEPNEENNLRSVDIRVISKPDLYMGDNDILFSPPSNIDIGDEVTISASVRNSGETPAVNVFIRFYDGDPLEGGRIISWKETQPSVSINRIPAGGYNWANVTWTPSSGGDHNIFIILDLVDAVDESNEDNNKISWPIYVRTLPDLELTNISLNQGDFKVNSAGVGSKLTINTTVENTGDTAAPTFRLRFFNGDFDSDPEPTPIGMGMTYLAGTLPGRSSMFVEMPWTVDYPKGIRTIIVELDLLEGVEQTSANNRIFYQVEVFDIQDVPELLPSNGSLVVSTGYDGIDLDLDFEPRAYLGMNLSVNLNLTNIGGKAASNATVLFMASNDTDSWVELYSTIPFLETNGTDMINGFWNLKSLGMNRLRIVVDPENSLREFDEGNNVLTLEVEVIEAPDISIELIRDGDIYNVDTGQYEMKKDKEYEVTFHIVNNGNFSFEDLDVEFNDVLSLADGESYLRTIDLLPYDDTQVTFRVKPAGDVDDVLIFRVTVDDQGRFYESDVSNNEATAVVLVKEGDQASNLWIIIIVILLLLLVIGGIAGYFIYKKYQTKDMAKCSNCGGLVEMEADLCPHCGVEFSEELECECGEIIPQGAVECPSCHRPISGDQSPVDESDEDEEEGDEEEGEEFEELEEEAEDADEIEEIPSEEFQEEDAPEPVVEAESEDEEELAECFECGALIPVSAPICPHCGAVFE